MRDWIIYIMRFFAVVILMAATPAISQTQREVDSIIEVNNLNIYEKPDNVIKAGESIYKNTRYSLNSRVKSLIMVSDAYSSKRDYQQALKYFLEANELSKGSKDKKLQISVLNKTAVKYQQLKVYDKALQYLDEAQKLIDEHPHEDSLHHSKGMNYIVRGLIFKEQINCDIAIGYFDKGIKEMLKSDDKSAQSILSIATYNKGNCYFELDNYKKASESFLEAISYAEKIKANSLKAFALKGLAQVYLDQGKYHESINALNEALVLSKDVNDIVLNKVVYNGLAYSYLHLNDWPNYQKYYKKYVAEQQKLTISERKSISDSLDDLEAIKNKKLLELQTSFYYKAAILILLILLAVFVLYKYQKRSSKSLNLLSERVEKMKKHRLEVLSKK